MNISFIGFGNMAQAIAKGLLRYPEYRISASAPSLKTEITDEGIRTHSSNAAIVPNADVIILTVKPAQMDAAYQSIEPVVTKNQLFISVAAGINLNWFAQKDSNQAIIRAMPNIGAAVSASATPLLANKLVSDEQKQIAERIFTTVGLTTWVAKEHEMDVFTALSGSGIAYVYRFMEAMIQAGVSLGLEKKTAASFTLQTFNGALKSAQQSGLNLAELRKQVTSPGGTTAAALEVFETTELDNMVLSAMEAAVKRAKELGG